MVQIWKIYHFDRFDDLFGSFVIVTYFDNFNDNMSK